MLEILQDMVERGEFPAGQRLPSERKLAEKFGVPQSQIHRKLQKLVEMGLLECFRGNGYFPKSRFSAAKPLHKIALLWERRNTDNPNEDFYAGLMFSLAPEYEQSVSVFNFPQDAAGQNKLLLQLLHEGYEGVFCYPHFVTGLLPGFLELHHRGVPVFFWDYSPLPGIFPAVGIDHFHTSMKAAEILASQNQPVTYLGFQGSEQNRLKQKGFQAGCELFRVPVEQEIMLNYQTVFNEKIIIDADLQPGKLYFTSTRMLSTALLGAMFDRGYLPGRDYQVLTTDRIRFIDESVLQIDSLMRDNMRVTRRLLQAMLDAIVKRSISCHDWRYPARYIPGNTLKH
ncbi:MAG: GntR family transcriptional regulator [Lentisphaerae bacterium]|nr:GntR family transcriptional regulator [Lentisphaerota bacterium]